MNTTEIRPGAANMSQTETSADPAQDGFAALVADLLHDAGLPESGELAFAIVDAYAGRIAHERQAADRAGREVRILVDRDQAKDLILGQMKSVVGQTVLANSRAHAHIAHMAGQIGALRHLAEDRPDRESLVDREDVRVILEERYFHGAQDHPMVAGFASSREYSMGRFRREYTDLAVHLAFIGWSVVVGNTHRVPVTSLLEATFQVDGHPLPVSALAARGLALEQLLP